MLSNEPPTDPPAATTAPPTIGTLQPGSGPGGSKQRTETANRGTGTNRRRTETTQSLMEQTRGSPKPRTGQWKSASPPPAPTHPHTPKPLPAQPTPPPISHPPTAGLPKAVSNANASRAGSNEGLSPWFCRCCEAPKESFLGRYCGLEKVLLGATAWTFRFALLLGANTGSKRAGSAGSKRGWFDWGWCARVLVGRAPLWMDSCGARRASEISAGFAQPTLVGATQS